MTIFKTLFGKGCISNAPRLGHVRSGLKKLWRYATFQQEQLTEEKTPHALKEIKTHFVYILRSLKDQKYYIGTTSDLHGCFSRHNSGQNPTTVDRRPFELIFYEAHRNVLDAKEREAYLKSNAGNKYLKKTLKHFLQSKPPSKRKNILRIVPFVSLIMLIILTPIIYVVLYTPSQTAAAWFDDGWKYRRRINIASHTSAENNVYVTVPAFDASDNNKFQLDCGDLRFTTEQGQLLQYYVNDCDTSSTVRVLWSTLPAGEQNYYMYYGNPSAPNGFSLTDFTTAASGLGSQTLNSEAQGTVPTSYWKFDEGVDDTCSGGVNDACDSTTGGNNLAFTNSPSWRTENLCVSGKCVEFNGSTNYAATTSTALLDAGAAYTVSAWIRPTFAGESTIETFLAKNGVVTFSIDDSVDNVAVTYGGTSASSTQDSISANRWHHIAITHNGSGTIAIYINGVDRTSDSSVTDTDSAAVMVIGSETTGTTSQSFDGFIDDVKIFNFARTAAQIKTDAAARGDIEGVSTSIAEDTQKPFSDGLVGYWKMDEGTGATTTDASGNGFTGTLTNSPTWTTGKYGSGGLFGNSTNYISAGDQSQLELTTFTISTWYYRTGTCGAFTFCSLVSKGKDANIGYNLSIVDNGGYKARLTLNDTQEVNGTSLLNANQWYHIAASVGNKTIKIYVNGVLETSTAQTQIPTYSTEEFKIGNSNDNSDLPGEGTIDEVRVYNRALSETEIRSIYNQAPGPIGHYKMDENTGTTTTYDSSGNGYNGTITTATWTPGKFGPALLFNGSTDYVTMADGAAFSSNTFSISSWIYRTIDSGANEMVFDNRDANDDGVRFFVDGGASPDSMQCSYNTIDLNGTTGIALNTWTHVECTSDGATLKIFVNGIQESSIALSGSIAESTNARLGTVSYSATQYFPGKIDEVKFYNYARSLTQIVEDINAGHPAAGSPIGSQMVYWKMDEANGTTLNNSVSTETSLTGTVSGPAWVTTGTCKFSQCLKFTANADLVSAGDVSFLDASASMSATLWLYPTTLSTQQMILSKANETTQRMFTIQTDDSTSSEIRVYIANTATDTSNYFLTSGLGLTANTWQQLSVIYDGTQGTSDRVKVYKNGRIVSGSVTGTIPTGVPGGTTSNLKLGRGDDTTRNALVGLMDELKIYNYALTQDHVGIDFNANAAINFGTGADSSEAAQLSDGVGAPPVGYWNLDENTGTSAKDISGNGNTGTLTNFSSDLPFLPGKFGSSVFFDGTSDVIDMGDPTSGILDFGSGSFTLSVWFNTNKPTGNIGRIISKSCFSSTAGYYFGVRIDTGTPAVEFHLCGPDSTNAINIGTTNTTYNDGKWHHAVAVVNASTTIARIYVDGVAQTISEIGTTCVTISGNDADFSSCSGLNASSAVAFSLSRGSSQTFTGRVDEVKVYNYARTPAQVAYDFNRGRPVGWWKLDECEGTTAYDSMGTYNGTLTITTTSVGTCSTGSTAWGNGETGKRNYSLSLDGNGDFVSVGDIGLSESTAYTWAGWFKTSGSPATGTIYAEGNSANNNAQELGLGDGKLCIWDNDNISGWMSVCGTSSVNNNSWHHGVVVKDGSNSYKIYVDSRLENSGSVNAGTRTVNTSAIGILDRGTDADAFTGQIDDVRVFNYSLSAIQIKKLYNDDASAFFGPATGSP